jgi:hypothetical protein
MTHLLPADCMPPSSPFLSHNSPQTGIAVQQTRYYLSVILWKSTYFYSRLNSMGKKRGSSGTHHFQPALVDDRERAVSDEVLGGVLVDADRLHPESVRGRAGRGDVSGHGAALSITGGGLAQDISVSPFHVTYIEPTLHCFLVVCAQETNVSEDK